MIVCPAPDVLDETQWHTLEGDDHKSVGNVVIQDDGLTAQIADSLLIGELGSGLLGSVAVDVDGFGMSRNDCLAFRHANRVFSVGQDTK